MEGVHAATEVPGLVMVLSRTKENPTINKGGKLSM